MSASSIDSRKFATITTKSGNTIEIDLSEFFDGGYGVDRTGSWPGDFKGRPQLASELRDYLEREPMAKESWVRRLTGARNLFRFLDESLDLPAVASMSDITEIHGIRVKRWITARGVKAPHTYQNIKTVVQGCRDMLRLDALIWPARDPDPAPDVDEPDYPGIQRLSMALRHHAREIKQMLREGLRLANLGRDPRIGPDLVEQWNRPENQAWLVREITSVSLPLKDELLASGARGLIWKPFGGRIVYGPEYLAPCMTPRGREGYVGKLRWFYLGFYDVASLIWLVMLHTGWNLATVLAIDISRRSEWAEPHPHQAGFVVIHAWKNRANRHQFAICRKRPEFHPFKIVQFMIAKTRRLRKTLRIRLEQLENKWKQQPNSKLKAEIERLQKAVKSPWLFHSLGKGGQVSYITSNSGPLLNKFVRTVVSSESLDEAHPYLATLSTSQARDSWINYAYVSTGQTLAAQHAAGHPNQRTLRHYLSVRRYRRASEKKYRSFQNHVFSEIVGARRLDATRLRILVQKGEITAEEETRLLDLRNRTRHGMRCLDPLNPPEELDPDHASGELCRVQRCTGCAYGVAFDDAVTPLAYALADLHAERRLRPLDAWRGTSLEDEEKSIAATLRQFEPDTVRIAYQARVEELQSGAARVFDAYPLY